MKKKENTVAMPRFFENKVPFGGNGKDFVREASGSVGVDCWQSIPCPQGWQP